VSPMLLSGSPPDSPLASPAEANRRLRRTLAHPCNVQSFLQKQTGVYLITKAGLPFRVLTPGVLLVYVYPALLCKH
jgi:hypothetical protein